MKSSEKIELILIDTVAVILMAIKLHDWLIIFQIFAALAAGIYTSCRIGQFIVTEFRKLNRRRKREKRKQDS